VTPASRALYEGKEQQSRFRTMIHISHAVGSVFVRGLLEGLKQEHRAFHFHTTVGLGQDSHWHRFLPGGLRTEAERRKYPVSSSEMSLRPSRELGRLLSSRLGCRGLLAHETGTFSVDAVLRDLDDHVASHLRALQGGKAAAVHAYEDGALATFEAAREMGMTCSYELPIAHFGTVQKLLREEASRWPAWEPTLGGTRDSEAKLERKARELELADVVICPSRFVLDSLPEEVRRGKRCVVAEFGSPEGSLEDKSKEDARSRPLRLLFAGSMSQRKGLADLFAAMNLLKRPDVELVVMGSLCAPMDFYRREYPSFVYEPPRSHGEVLKLMRSCDVLVLPSIVEGRALVQQEAMRSGLPLIVTANAGASDLVEEGCTGCLVPIRDPEALADRISWFADQRRELPAMSARARRRAAQLTWQGYSRKILQAIDIVAT
jgi:glycosyltransferase involved in cell wall biosynthesis